MGEPIVLQLSVDEAEFLSFLASCYEMDLKPARETPWLETASDLVSKIDQQVNDVREED